MRAPTGLLAILIVVSTLVAVPMRAQDEMEEVAEEQMEEVAEEKILLAENFDDPTTGVFPTGPDRGYVDGEYQLAKLDPTSSGAPGASPLEPYRGPYTDVGVTVNTRLVGDPVGATVMVECRAQFGSSPAYRLTVSPVDRAARLDRIGGPAGPATTLGDWTRSTVIESGNAVNRLELVCVGNRILGGVNGVPVLAAEDDSYTQGTVRLLVWGTGVAEARFDNLVVTQRAADELPSIAPPEPMAAPPAVPSPGSVLLFDNFDDPTLGRLPKASPEPSHVLFGYVAGEYQIQTLTPGARWAALPAAYSDASVAIDARIVGDETGRTLALVCRLQGGSGYGYRLFVSPSSRSFVLDRWDGGTPVILVNWQPSASIRRGNSPNRIELGCTGSTISAAINGSAVAAVRDTTYAEGAIWIGVGGSSVTADARFDNLLVTQRDPAEPPPPLPPPPKPGDVLLTDNFDDLSLGWLPLAPTGPDISQGYIDGAYEIINGSSEPTGIVMALVPGTYANSSISVDVRVFGGPDRRSGFVFCRATASGGYRFLVRPALQLFSLQRYDGRQLVVLRSGTSAAIRPGGDFNRLDLSCAGSVITASVNGTTVAVAEDATYASGTHRIGVGQSGATARFDNLVATQR